MELDDAPPRTTRARWAVRFVLLALGLGSVGFWAYGKYLAPKSPLGGPCAWAVNCGPAAPRCMRESASGEAGEGVCSRPCTLGEDCAPDVRCVSVELDERDERGVPLQGGYCVPQWLIDKKKGRPTKDAAIGESASDGWVPVPRVAGQLEGEVTATLESGESRVVWVKGSLVRLAPAPGPRVVVDAATGRSLHVDDAKATFTATSIDATGGDVLVDKTAERDTVAGAPCEVWRLTDGSARLDVCIVQRGAFADPKGSLRPRWLRELGARGAFPLRAARTDPAGKGKVVFLVTALSERPLDASLFAVPKAYRNVGAKR